MPFAERRTPAAAHSGGTAEARHVEPLSGSATGVVVGCIMTFFGILLISGLVALLCILRRRRQLYRSRRAAAYADADSIAFQDDHHSQQLHHHHLRRNTRDRDGTEATGLYSHHTFDSNEPVTPPDAPAQPPPPPPPPAAAADAVPGRWDNYADRHNDGYDTGDHVRPASPNAERVEGVTIENRVRPRRNLPRGQVVIHHENQDVCLDFRGVERVPQAGPPPLTEEEKQRLIDAANRVASPDFYGRAEYEHRRASNTNTPNVLLSSSLLYELQQQYAAASASGHVFPSYASDAGRSIGSMSFRPGSQAGSVRRTRRDGRQSTSPTSASLGMQQQLRRRTNRSRQHANSRDPSGATGGRQYGDDLESTSDDFEDVSLHDGSFALRNASRSSQQYSYQPHHQQQQQQQHNYNSQLPISMMLNNGVGLAFDQMSLRSNSPGAFERYMSAPGSVHGGGGMNNSMASGFGVPSPLDGPQEAPPLPAAALAHSLGSPNSVGVMSADSPVGWLNGAGGPAFPATGKAMDSASRHYDAQQHPKNTTITNGSSTSHLSMPSRQSSKASPAASPALPGAATGALSPSTPPNPIIDVLPPPPPPATAADSMEAVRRRPSFASTQTTPALSLSAGVVAGQRGEQGSRALLGSGGPHPHLYDTSLNLNSSSISTGTGGGGGGVSPYRKDGQTAASASAATGLDRRGPEGVLGKQPPTVFLTEVPTSTAATDMRGPLSRPSVKGEKTSTGTRSSSGHSKTD